MRKNAILWIQFLTLGSSLLFRTTQVAAPIANRLTAEPIVYGQSIEAPLPSIGRSFDFMDWDGDGLKDYLVLLHPRYTGLDAKTAWSKIIVVRNIGQSDKPLFASAEQHRTILHDPRLGFHFALIDFNSDGKREIISIKENTARIFLPKNDAFTPEWSVLEGKIAGSSIPSLGMDVQEASPTIGVVDWDGDGKEDLLLGVNQHTVMKRGFGVDYSTMNPTAGRIFYCRNVSSNDIPIFEKPIVLKINDKPIECFGWVYPSACDVDGDGLPDLIVSEHRPGIRIFKNEGKRTQPILRFSGTIEDNSENLQPTALAFQVRPTDLDGDGRPELVTTSYFGSPSLLQWYRKTESLSHPKGWYSEGFLKMKTHHQTPLVGPGISTIDPVDWDSDGDTDLLLGGEPGTPMVALNIGTEKEKVFDAPKRLRFSDGSWLETYSSELGDGSHHGPKEWFDDRSTPRAIDWDRDGIIDIVSGTQGRRLYWMRGTIVKSELRFERPLIFEIDDKPLLHPHRCLPFPTDWDKDGYLDIIGFNQNSDLVVYSGRGDSRLRSITPLQDTQGKPISASPKIEDPSINASPSGRSGIAAVDWDQDGITDLITFKHYFDGRVLFHKGVDQQTFEPAVKLFDFFSHLGGPSIIDWNLDGHADILMGGDYRRLAGLSYQMPNETRSHYFVYQGESLPIPSARGNTQ